MREPRLVLFDGHALVHRAFHALPPLTISRTGELISAVYGFAQMMLKALNELKPTCCAVAFDRAAPTFRHEMFEQYKGHRPATPDELVNQFTRVRQLVNAFNIPIYELDGYEADDVLGTLARQAAEQGIPSVIVTGDADTMQLVSPAVKVLYPKPRGPFSNTILYDEAGVLEKYGFRPSLVPDFKALTGDPSDNIPGVPGIGDKTAARLIQQFGPVEEIYAHIKEVAPPRIAELLLHNEAQVRQSKELATIDVNAPVSLNLEQCQVNRFDRQQVSELFRELEFFSLLPRLPEPETEPVAAPTPAVPPPRINIVDTPEELARLVEYLSPAKPFAFEVIISVPNPMLARIVGIALSAAPGEAYYIPAGHSGLDVRQLSLGLVLDTLRPFFDRSHAALAHNVKPLMTALAEHGLDTGMPAFDTNIAAHLLGEKALTLKALAFTHLGTELPELAAPGAKPVPVASAGIGPVAAQAGAAVDAVRRLTDIFGSVLRERGLWSLFADVEMPLVPVLARMERNGVALDAGVLRDMSYELGRQVREVEAKIYNLVGHEFNIGSPQQLSSVLFQDLHLPPPRKTRGIYSTGATVLEELLGQHPIIELIMEYRQLTKIMSTYIDALPGLVNPKTGRVHTTFNQTRTATGRLSSNDPNLQNIPVRGDLGRRVRTAFIAPPGSRLLAGDYSQIDLRVLAHLSQDERLLEAFRRDEDIHAVTAAQLFNIESDRVTPDMRRLAKTVNFGVIYGMSEYGLEQATELSREEANRFIAAYFEKYPGVRQYLDNVKKQARDTGYVQTLLGRRRAIPEIHSSNRIIREAAERMAINMPVQGTSADIIKVAMIELHMLLLRHCLGSRMLLQVHDELIFEVPEPELEQMKVLVCDVMSSAIKLTVPLKVDVKSGRNWGEME